MSYEGFVITFNTGGIFSLGPPTGLHVEKPGSRILHIYAGTSMCKIQVSATIVPAAEPERLVFVPELPRKSPIQ